MNGHRDDGCCGRAGWDEAGRMIVDTTIVPRIPRTRVPTRSRHRLLRHRLVRSQKPRRLSRAAGTETVQSGTSVVRAGQTYPARRVVKTRLPANVRRPYFFLKSSSDPRPRSEGKAIIIRGREIRRRRRVRGTRRPCAVRTPSGTETRDTYARHRCPEMADASRPHVIIVEVRAREKQKAKASG